MHADWLNEERLECGLACRGLHTLFTGQREKRERERREKREERREKREEREREKERDVELSRIIFIFKRNDGCLGTF